MVELLTGIFNDWVSATLLPAMILTAALDFAAATVGNLRAGTFTFLLWGKWAGDKGVAIISVALLYACAAAATAVDLPVGENFDLNLVFGVPATAMATAFIATQIASILKNLQAPPPPEHPVPPEPEPAP